MFATWIVNWVEQRFPRGTQLLTFNGILTTEIQKPQPLKQLRRVKKIIKKKIFKFLFPISNGYCWWYVFVIFFFFNQLMAVQRKLPTKLCEWPQSMVTEKKHEKMFQGCRNDKRNSTFFQFTVQTTAHSQKVSCVDIGETGRVLVTGGQDRLVNLFAIGNDKPIQVRRSSWVVCEMWNVMKMKSRV